MGAQGFHATRHRRDDARRDEELDSEGSLASCVGVEIRELPCLTGHYRTAGDRRASPGRGAYTRSADLEQQQLELDAACALDMQRVRGLGLLAGPSSSSPPRRHLGQAARLAQC